MKPAFLPSTGYPTIRMRRLRQHPILRSMVRETELNPADFIFPIFVRPGMGLSQEISSMPGMFQWSIDRLAEIVDAAVELGIKSFILFGLPTYKNAHGDSALAEDGIIQQALRSLRKSFGNEIFLITDECLCEYTDHGHCGVLFESGGRIDVHNELTLPVLVQQCLSHVRAGADMVAPSGMMDGMVKAIRLALDEAEFPHVPIMSYSAKFASGFYGPFREAADSPPQFGDRTSYQMDPANHQEAIREAALDVNEGADIIMVKPALAYLDVIRQVKDIFGLPTAAYNVSGEFAMVKAAARNGWIDEKRVTLEILTSIKRSGADMILTYHALDAARWLKYN